MYDLVTDLARGDVSMTMQPTDRVQQLRSIEQCCDERNLRKRAFAEFLALEIVYRRQIGAHSNSSRLAEHAEEVSCGGTGVVLQPLVPAQGRIPLENMLTHCRQTHIIYAVSTLLAPRKVDRG